MPHSPKVRQGAPYNKTSGSLGRAPARRLYELQAFPGQIVGVPVLLSQQTVTAYENGSRRVPISHLPRLATLLGTSVEAMLDEGKAAKRGPASKLQQLMERIAQQPRSRQQFIIQVIESVLAQRP